MLNFLKCATIISMTTRDYQAIHTLYWFHRYLPASIAKLYACSTQHILDIINERPNETVISEIECQICSADECQPYYIDGNRDNNKPQNIIQLCEPHKRRFQHMQLKKRNGVLEPQMEA